MSITLNSPTIARYLPTFSRWTAFSIISFLSVLALTIVSREILKVPARYAIALPLFYSIIANFFICRHLVFLRQTESIFPQFVKYLCSVAGFRFADFLLFWLLVEFLNVWYVVAVLLVLPATFVLKFLFFRSIVFTTSKGD